MENRNSKKVLRQIVLASLFAALTTVLTCYIKIPSHNGYIHFGDSIIYLAACFLPTPIAMLAGGIGGMLADAIGGYTMYMLPTFIIKAILVLPFSSEKGKIICKRNMAALIPAACVTFIGYYLTEVILLGLSFPGGFMAYVSSGTSWVAALNTLSGNAVQVIASSIIFIFLGLALDKTKIKNKI